MKIESDQPKKPLTKAQTVRNVLGKGKQQAAMMRAPRDRTQKQTIVNLFGGKPLNIFTETSAVPDQLDTWSQLEKREMKLAVTHPPRNYFGKSNEILWQ